MYPTKWQGTEPFKTGDKKALRLEECYHQHKEMWIEMLSLMEGKEKKYFIVVASQNTVGYLLRGNGGHLEKTIPFHSVAWI